jgi:CRP-like cAMP-binding protein
MANNSRPSTTISLQAASSDGDGNHIHNEILLGLPTKESDLLFPKLEFVRLMTHHVLHEPGDTLKSAYFCDSGLISILSVFPDGKSVEVGLVGKEGLSATAGAGFCAASTRAIAKSCLPSASTARYVAILRQYATLERRLQQFAQVMAMQSTQIAACNRLHEVDERLARWLLMSADRIGSNSVPLTQEFLAQILGTRRSSVTVAAGILQKAGLIADTRRHVEIVDRRRLTEEAGEL